MLCGDIARFAGPGGLRQSQRTVATDAGAAKAAYRAESSPTAPDGDRTEYPQWIAPANFMSRPFDLAAPGLPFSHCAATDAYRAPAAALSSATCGRATRSERCPTAQHSIRR